MEVRWEGRTCELAHQALAGAEIADDAAARNTLEDILAVPGDEVAVVDDVFFAFAELASLSAFLAIHGRVEDGKYSHPSE